MVMESLSNWALPRGRSVELNRDDYTRLTIDKRYAAYAVGLREGFLDVDEVRAMERLGPMPQNAGRQTSAPTNNGRQDLTAAKALTGGTN
jgi:phage portal protein BeeE